MYVCMHIAIPFVLADSVRHLELSLRSYLTFKLPYLNMTVTPSREIQMSGSTLTLMI